MKKVRALIQCTPWLRWIPLINLNVEQIIVLMQSAKVYVEFGGHPSKVRMPREAAASGCWRVLHYYKLKKEVLRMMWMCRYWKNINKFLWQRDWCSWCIK